jgi:predicted dehydrogenase
MIDVVCVGAGWVTEERHLPALRHDPRVRVLGVVDVHPERARALARRARLPAWGVSLAEPWAASARALTVGVPPFEHAPVIRAGLARSLHCLSEKPLALPAAVAAALAADARAAGVVLAVVHNFQFADGAARLFRLLDGGRLGPVRSVFGFQLSNPGRRLPSWYRALPGGLFLDESPHLLYLFRRVLGRIAPRAVDGSVAGGAVRSVVATFEHESVWAVLSMTFDASVSEWHFVVVGDRRIAVFDLFRDVLVVLPNDGTHRGAEVLRTTAALVGGHLGGVVASGTKRLAGRLHYGHREVVRRFLDAIEGHPDRLSGIAADDGVAVAVAIEALCRRLGVSLEAG